jgi:hypothetical protein
MAEEGVRVVKVLVGKDEFRMVQTVMREARPKAEMEADAPPTKGP